MLSLSSPYPFFSDKDGDPLDGGYIYVGEVAQNPETSPVDVFWDEALTQPAAQPLRTLNGYIVRSGTPARVYVEGDDFSMTCKNSKGVILFYERSVAAVSTLRDDLADASSATKGAGMVGYDETNAYPADTVGAELKAQGTQIDALSTQNSAEFGAIQDISAAVTLYGATAAGAGTYSFKQVRIKKVGSIALVQFEIIFSAHTGVGDLRLQGLTYEAGPSNFPFGYGMVTYFDGGTTVQAICTPIGPGSNSSRLRFIKPGNSALQITTSGTLKGSFTYLVP